jgi:hypothetical protein
MEPSPDRPDANPNIPDKLISTTTLRYKTLREQQAVLSLQVLAQQDSLSEKVLGNQLSDLTDKLVLGAGEDVVGLSELEEWEQLEAFQRLITRRLSILRAGGEEMKRELSDGGRVLVNGAGPGNRRGHGSAGVLGGGISKPASESKSKSRERRSVSRGRK